MNLIPHSKGDNHLSEKQSLGYQPAQKNPSSERLSPHSPNMGSTGS